MKRRNTIYIAKSKVELSIPDPSEIKDWLPVLPEVINLGSGDTRVSKVASCTKEMAEREKYYF